MASEPGMTETHTLTHCDFTTLRLLLRMPISQMGVKGETMQNTQSNKNMLLDTP